jgi:hypothetical protein
VFEINVIMTRLIESVPVLTLFLSPAQYLAWCACRLVPDLNLIPHPSQTKCPTTTPWMAGDTAAAAPGLLAKEGGDVLDDGVGGSGGRSKGGGGGAPAISRASFRVSFPNFGNVDTTHARASDDSESDALYNLLSKTI